MDEPVVATDVERRAAAAVRTIPAERLHIFCASCAERFLGGYAAWLAEEISLDERAASLPSPQFLRRAIDVCWEGAGRSEADDLLRALSGMMPGDHEQPIFKSRLNGYFDEAPWLVRLGLSCLIDPKVGFALYASAAALDFHNQILGRRKATAGMRPDFDDLETDLRDFEIDPGAVAESAIQVKDADELLSGVPDLNVMRERSADRGRDVLDEVHRLLVISPHPNPPRQAGEGNERP